MCVHCLVVTSAVKIDCMTPYDMNIHICPGNHWLVCVWGGGGCRGGDIRHGSLLHNPMVCSDYVHLCSFASCFVVVVFFTWLLTSSQPSPSEFVLPGTASQERNESLSLVSNGNYCIHIQNRIWLHLVTSFLHAMIWLAFIQFKIVEFIFSARSPKT